MSPLYTDADRARVENEPADDGDFYRTPFRRDYARLIHSPAFRRLQGQTQLFPGIDSDFFRNRLTHSLEVAQVAKSIALRLNHAVPELAEDPIDLDVVEFAGLAHDLGHPPFGHNGEHALDKCMRSWGGFEGNAQTLRILSRLEKKRFIGSAADDDPLVARVGFNREGTDFRAGLNLAARSLAAVLKYDRVIPVGRDPKDSLAKGYYETDTRTVEWIRKQVSPQTASGAELKTIECQIMDLADDIAYSTYDLEDAFKAGFLSPISLLAVDEETREEVARRATKGAGESISAQDVLEELLELFPLDKKPLVAYRESLYTASNGYLRTGLSTRLVGSAVNAVKVEWNSANPAISRAFLESSILKRVEILKHLTFTMITRSPRLQVAEYRGDEIVTTIFEALVSAGGERLLPDDVQATFRYAPDKPRVVCDFVAGMTDAYAIEFYARLKSERARTIFKPL